MGPIARVIILEAVKRITLLTQRLVSGIINAAEWYERMQTLLRAQWLGAFQIGVGRAITEGEQSWLLEQFNAHSEFLTGFYEDLANLSPEQAIHRASLYGNRLRGVYEAGRVRGMGIALPRVPGDGQTRCLMNCQCHLEFVEVEGYVDVFWKLGEAEHCPDCEDLSSEWNPLRVEREVQEPKEPPGVLGRLWDRIRRFWQWIRRIG